MKTQKQEAHKIRSKKPGNKTGDNQVEITNSLTVNNIAEFKKKVEKCMSENNSFKILGKNLEIIDIAGLQLLYTIKNWAIENNKKMEFDVTLNAEVTELHEISGLTTILKN